MLKLKKRCPGCKQLKSPSEFYRQGLDHYCKVCRSASNSKWEADNKDKAAACRRAWRKKNPHRVRASHIQRLYGLTLEQYDAIRKQQKDRCAVCKTKRPGDTERHGWFWVDHCHRTGRVRGLLCPRCNTGLGAFRDDPAMLKAALAYLEVTESCRRTR